ncbi:MAG TPA: SDR family NAD(P)-dependent oxidoreductase [Methanomicrobiales archaeon]|nr:SDR family NAD(P)-dependent oxidoreductase [Methanomicrobiales archaeon]
MTLSHSLAGSPAAAPRTILVTGSTDGIGKATAKALARQGHRVLLHGRDQEKGRAVLGELASEGSTEPDLFTADLSTLPGVRALAREVSDRYERLDVLLNNAGIYLGERVLTADGFETTLAVNLVAPFLLSHLLLPVLSAAAPARIVNVASSAHFDAPGIDWENLQGEREYDGWGAYARSKLGVVLFTAGFARELDPGEITVNCLHPGVICTKLLRSAFPVYPCDTPEAGSRTSVYLATSPRVDGVTGKYFDGMREARPSAASRDRKTQDRLIAWLGKAAGLE